jgi:transcriptional regulator with XRE-family HTH domain
MRSVRKSYRRILAQNVQRLRVERELTQKTLAAHTRVSTDWISLIEQGRVNPTLEVIVKLAHAFGVMPQELLSAPPQSP